MRLEDRGEGLEFANNLPLQSSEKLILYLFFYFTWVGFMLAFFFHQPKLGEDYEDEVLHKLFVVSESTAAMCSRH